MPDMSDPLAMMRNRARNTELRARRLRHDAAMLIARAEELEVLAADLDGDVRDVEKWGKKP